jgi:hypothetical protein
MELDLGGEASKRLVAIAAVPGVDPAPERLDVPRDIARSASRPASAGQPFLRSAVAQ